MSRSIHITGKTFKGLTKSEIDEQYVDPKSDLSQFAKKISIKKRVIKLWRQDKPTKKQKDQDK
jgi:hypothetical protein